MYEQLEDYDQSGVERSSLTKAMRPDLEFVGHDWGLHVKVGVYNLVSLITSGTAQGGGGSFKNRKPIGEVGCCESGMAERATDGPKGAWGLPLTLSRSFSDYLPTYLSSMYLSIYLSTYLSLSLSFI